MTLISKTNTLVFPDIEAYSKEIGLSTDVLKEAYKIEAKGGHLN